MIIHDIVTQAIKNGIGLGSSEQCYVVMYSIVRAFQIKRIVEIGTYKGYSAIIFCQAVLDNKLIPECYAIDLWNHKGKIFSSVKKEALLNFSKSGFDKYITVIHGDSKIEIPKLFNKINNVDLCFIDGDHKTETVLCDYNNCKNYTKYILFHDTGKGKEYLSLVESEGWKITIFPTKYIEGDGHLVGISLAIKNE